MSRVAIVGSCITRDVWRFRGASTADLLYISRSSLPALTSRPVTGFMPSDTPPNGLKSNPHRAVVADLRKTALPALLAFRPTHIVFDFIDERFDLLNVGGAMATRSAELLQSGYLEQPALAGARRISRRSPAAVRLWEEALLSFAGLIATTHLSEAKLILHAARWADHSQGASGDPAPLTDVTILPGEPADIAEQNRLQAHYETCFTSVLPAAARIEAPGARLADREHLWGLSPFHYIPAYYEEIAGQLEARGVSLRPAVGD